MRQDVLGVLYIGVISTAVSMYLWVKCFELLDAGIAALTFFAQRWSVRCADTAPTS